jgi:hypothetical protein
MILDEATWKQANKLLCKIKLTTLQRKRRQWLFYKDFSIMWQIVGLLYSIQPADKTYYPKQENFHWYKIMSMYAEQSIDLPGQQTMSR